MDRALPQTTSSASEPRLLTDEHVLVAFADDFGHLVHQPPHAVAPISSTAEAVAAVRYALAHALPFVPRGTGHSTAGQSQTSGLVLDMRPLNFVGPIEGNRITVGAGATWHSVTQATLQAGLAPPVLTDYINISVGGTLSVGGISGTTHHHGLQTDNVDTLEVVTPDGDATVCSRETRPDLFDAVRAGRGRNGIITHATLNLVPAPDRTRVHHAYYRDLAAFLHDQLDLMRSGTADYVEGHAKPTETGGWHYRIEAAYHYGSQNEPDDALLHAFDYDEVETDEVTYWDFVNRLAEGERFLRENGHWVAPHLWTNYLLPHRDAAEIIGEVMATLTADDISDSGTVIIYPVPVSAVRTPAFPLPAQCDTATLFAILRTIPSGDIARVQALWEANDTISELVAAAGGTNYLNPL